MRLRRLTVLLYLSLTACGGGGPSAVAPLPNPQPRPVVTIPNLTAGPHIGYIVGFDALNAQQQADADTRFAQAVAAGMQVSRVQLGWDELESAPGVYELGELMAALDQAVVSGQQPFFTLTTLDTGSLTIPADLVSADGVTPAPGLNLDGPEIEARFRSFLDWLVPELQRYDVWGLAIANEPSTLFEDIGQVPITNFLVNGASYANSLTNQIAITVTIAGGADNRPEIAQFIADQLPQLDIVSYNYYCLRNDTLQVSDPQDWVDDVSTFIARASGRQIFFQELGCPAGWGDIGGTATPPPTTINATAQIQADFLRFMLTEIEARPELRAATIFQLNDWSPALARSFSDPFRMAGEPVAADRLEEWLATVGLCRWSDGTCRPAFDEFISAAGRMEAVRANQ